MMRPLEEQDEELQSIPDAAAAAPTLLHPYHAYVSPRSPSTTDTAKQQQQGQEQQQERLLTVEEDEGNDDDHHHEDDGSKPLRQLRANLRRQETLAARPWWRLRSASYLLLALVGMCYLGGRSLLLR